MSNRRSQNIVSSSPPPVMEAPAPSNTPLGPSETPNIATRVSKRHREGSVSKQANGLDLVALPPRKTRKKNSITQGEKDLAALGRFIGRMVFHTVNMTHAILEVHTGQEAQDPSIPRYQMFAEDEVWLLVDKYFRTELLEVSKNGGGLLCSTLDRGLRDGRAADIKSLKPIIAGIYELDDMPTDRSLWGFHNLQTASLLRPDGVEKDSQAWDEFLLGVTIEPGAWAAFMWDGRNGPIDPENVHEGFLMDLALIKVARSILFPPAFLNKQTVPDSGFAYSWSVRGVSKAFIAYVVMLVRFLLSDDTRFGLEQFNYNIFYEHLVAYLEEDVVKSQVTKIIKWWDSHLFPQATVQTITKDRHQKVIKKTIGVVSSSIFISQAWQREREKENRAPSLSTLADAALKQSEGRANTRKSAGTRI